MTTPDRTARRLPPRRRQAEPVPSTMGRYFMYIALAGVNLGIGFGLLAAGLRFDIEAATSAGLLATIGGIGFLQLAFMRTQKQLDRVVGRLTDRIGQLHDQNFAYRDRTAYLNEGGRDDL